MINKRLLIKNLLAHNDENSFYDKKLRIDLSSKEGKAKFLKHICALSNSNPNNNSYIIIGVEDQSNKIIGVDFFDDSKIQNLANAYLHNAPAISYENIHFPHLEEGKVVGLVTIKPNSKTTSISKNIWKYYGGTIFYREGSISKPQDFSPIQKQNNEVVVSQIETRAKNNIKLTLDGVMDFVVNRHKNLDAHYFVFQELFVVCWAGVSKQVGNKTFYSRVDIELINEQVKLFYSAFDEVKIEFTEEAFKITEYVQLGINAFKQYYPLEELVLKFNQNGFYSIESNLIFEPPKIDKKTLHHVYNSNNALLEKLINGVSLSVIEEKDLQHLPAIYLLCYLNGFEEALTKLEDAKPYLKSYDASVYKSLKEAFRIIRKTKYN